MKSDDVAAYALERLALPDTPSSRALLSLLDQTVSRLDRSGHILGVWIGTRHYVSDLPDVALDAFERASDLRVTDFLDAETGRRVSDLIATCLDTGRAQEIDYTSNATGRRLYLHGSCTPCGPDEVIWITRDVTAQHEERTRAENRARLESLISDGLKALIDVDGSDRDFRGVLGDVLERVARHFGATGVYLRRFRGQHRVEIVGQWRAEHVRYAPPGTSKAGPGAFPWAAHQLVRDPILIVPNVGALGPEAAVDVANLSDAGDHGFVWIRVGPPRQPVGLFGLTFDDDPPVTVGGGYEPLVGFAQAILGVIVRSEDTTRRDLQHRVFESIVRGEPLEAVLEQVCQLRETGSPGQRCIAWLVDSEGRLRPVGTAASIRALGGIDVCPVGSPEVEATANPERRWLVRNDPDTGSLGPVAEVLGATAVDLIPLVTRSGTDASGVLAVYDTSRLPLDPTTFPDAVPSDFAASLASIAVERITDLTELAHRATHDPLTGLANRTTFLDALERALAANEGTDRVVAVLYCDVDGFKDLNDRMGHDHGDRFLVEIAHVIEAQTTRSDLVARLGGDEFAILLERLVDEDDALFVAERIRGAVRATKVTGARPMTISIGAAVSASPADHAEGLLRDADIAMYQAKSMGRDRVEMFAERLRREARQRDELRRDLAGALERDEVEVYYQPMIDLADGSLMGFEALARWRHGDRGFVPPTEFIPIAESGGMIHTLGDAVLDQSLRVASAWKGLALHVNLSAHQIDMVGYVDRLLDKIMLSGVPVEAIAMEITESVLLSESAPTVENLRVLTESGVGLVLDDFGTGYASLTYLRRFPFRGIKVDRSFVSGIEGGADDAAIVSMVLALATSLGLEVIAEGVETAGQEHVLREMGCRFVQGFRYSLPVPATATAGVIDRFGRG